MKRAPAVQFFTHAGSLFGLDRIAAELGRLVEPMLARHGFGREVLSDPSLVVPYPSTCRLLEDCAREWACPDLGLRMGEQQSMDFLGPVGLLARLTDTVGEAIRAFEANMPVYSNAFSVFLEDGGTTNPLTTLIHYQPQPGAHKWLAEREKLCPGSDRLSGAGTTQDGCRHSVRHAQADRRRTGDRTVPPQFRGRTTAPAFAHLPAATEKALDHG